MSDENLDTLLPSPDAVRCGLCLDMALQMRWTIEELDVKGDIKEDELVVRLRRERDQALLERLRDLLPIEDLTSASRNRRIDISAIYRQHPFVYAMWVIRGADSLVELKEAFELSLKLERKD